MLYKLKYGHQEETIKISPQNPVQLLQSDLPDISLNEEKTIQKALDNPDNSLPLEKIIRKGEKTCIVVPDSTRSCRASVFLPILISRLNLCGIADQDMVILMANGSHRKNSPEELKRILGEKIINRISVVEHDYNDTKTLVHLGETRNGTPVLINRELIRAERIILTGGVLHHYLAGFGGGPKLITPGCAGYETIKKNHSFTIHPEYHALHPACFDGNIDDNPVHTDIRDSLKFVTVDFALQVVTNADGLIVQAFAGELFAAHKKACQAMHKLNSIPFQEQADLVIASCGGYPKDINMIQVHKTIHHAFYALKNNGIMIILAECSDGIGSRFFMEYFKNSPNLTELHTNLVQDFKINGNTALALKMKTENAKIFLKSELPPELVKKLGMIPVHSVSEAMETANSFLSTKFKTIIIPNAATYLPVHQFDPKFMDKKWYQDIINETRELVQQKAGLDISGSGYFHAWRVCKLAKDIAHKEGGNLIVIELAALLHFLVDHKSEEDSNINPADQVKDWLRLKRVPEAVVRQVCEIIIQLSLTQASIDKKMSSLEAKIVHDADLLDGMGAIGIARTFASGALLKQPLFQPQTATQEKAESNSASSIKYCYEKLLRLREGLVTSTAQKLGQERHKYMKTFLQKISEEWD